MTTTYSHKEIAGSLRLGTWTVRIIQNMVQQLLEEVATARTERDQANTSRNEHASMLRGGHAKNMELLNAIRRKRDDAREDSDKFRKALELVLAKADNDKCNAMDSFITCVNLAAQALGR